ncbi:IS3 family transposase, partial [Acinetobacter baumannii]|uniref:IS3 family transposase n=1 Tax=Acinetobacter baumannii TaxID=470 RepID=UPI00389169F8
CFYGEKFNSVEELEKTVKEYIHYYNHERIKVKLKGLSEPYRVCRRVNILRDYPDDKTKLYPRN